MLELEHGRVAVLDHDRGPGHRGQLRDQVVEAPVDQRPGQVGQGLALHHRGQPIAAGRLDGVVAGRQGPPFQ
jgi:hypothetical protein